MSAERTQADLSVGILVRGEEGVLTTSSSCHLLASPPSRPDKSTLPTMLLAILLLPALAALHASLAAPILGLLYATSTGLSLTTLLAAALFMSSHASANYVPNYICSWKPTPGSPELGGYECELRLSESGVGEQAHSGYCLRSDFCNAPKKKISSTYAEYHCSDHHEFVADLGALDLNRGILRFSELLPA